GEVRDRVAEGPDETACGATPDPRLCLDRTGFGSRRGSKRRWRPKLGAGEARIPSSAVSLGTLELLLGRAARRARSDEPRYGLDRQDPAAAARSRTQGWLRAELLRSGTVFGAMKILAALLWAGSLLSAAECA